MLVFVQYLSKGIQESYVTEEVIVSVLGQLREVSERFFTCCLVELGNSLALKAAGGTVLSGVFRPSASPPAVCFG